MSRWIIMLGGYEDAGFGFVLTGRWFLVCVFWSGKDKSSTRFWWVICRFWNVYVAEGGSGI